jgi:hypothetical protein
VNHAFINAPLFDLTKDASATAAASTPAARAAPARAAAPAAAPDAAAPDAAAPDALARAATAVKLEGNEAADVVMGVATQRLIG